MARFGPKTFFQELRRRRVLPIAGAYIAIAWLATEIAGYVLEQIGAPAWSLRLLAIVFMVGFPITVVLAWVVQVGPDGKRTLDSSKGQHKTVIGAILVGIVATAGLAWLILPRIGEVQSIPGYEPIPNSVAVLPFFNPDATPQETDIGETLYTALTNGLGAAKELSQMRLRPKEQPADLVAFGRRYNVGLLLTGRIQRSADSIRLEMSLLDVASGKPRWARPFNWKSSDIKGLGTEIGNAVLQSMGLPAVTEKRFAGTDNLDAYEAFLSGQLKAASFNITKLRLAVEDFERAIELDPSYVLACVALAETIGWYMHYKAPEQSERQALFERALKALETAQELDNESAAVISALGVASRDPVIARQSYEQALRLDPDHALSYYRLARLNGREGELAEAERLYRRALELDPRNADWRNDLAHVLWNQKRDEEAMAEIRMSIEIDPEYVFNYYHMGNWLYFDHGRYDEGLVYTRKAYSLDPENGSMAALVAGGYLDLQAREESLAWLDRIQELSPTSWATWFASYQAHYTFGDEKIALAHVERALELSSGDPWSLRALAVRDIADGKAKLALKRWQQYRPILATGNDWVVNDDYLHLSLFYAQTLMGAGQTERAQKLMQDCLELVNRWKLDPYARESWIWEIEPEIYASMALRTETLAAMRRSIVDGHYRAVPVWYQLPVFDFLRDDPEFKELMEILHNDLSAQLKRVRQMECNGELAPAPGVDPVLICD